MKLPKFFRKERIVINQMSCEDLYDKEADEHIKSIKDMVDACEVPAHMHDLKRELTLGFVKHGIVIEELDRVMRGELSLDDEGEIVIDYEVQH